MANLYELSGVYLSLWDEVDNPDFDLDSLEDAINKIESDLDQKYENTGKYIQSLGAMAESIGAAIKEQQHRKKVIENKVDRLKKYLFDNMKLNGTKKVSTPYFDISVVKNRSKVEIDDESLIPDEFLKIQEIKTPIKAAIKSELDSGNKVAGAKLVHGESLRIK